MKILVTGANGFLEKNLISQLRINNLNIIYEYDTDSDENILKRYTKDCDFVYHFAAVHRPLNSDEFDSVNRGFFEKLLVLLVKNNNTCPVLLTSSIQALDDNEYGRSKLAAENLLNEHGSKNNSRVIIYRLKNIFGKWAAPNQHSVVATFCYNIAMDLPIEVKNPDFLMNFYYVDDVIDSFMSHLQINKKPNIDGFYSLDDSFVYSITLQDLANLIYSFKESENCISAENIKDKLIKNFYLTYSSYLSEKSYDVKK